MTTMTMTDFLLARIAEDEEQARLSLATEKANPNLRLPEGWVAGVANRVLAECEAKRRIVERCARELVPAGDSVSAYDTEAYTDALASEVLEALALPYADHPDYREEWRP